MKKLIFLISFSIICLAVSAQPTSFGGITPGQTTREKLKSLVKNPNEVGYNDFAYMLKLNQPDGMYISVRFHNDIVYELDVGLNASPELKRALIEKYGEPRIKVGSIRKVACRNKFGASFERFNGEEELKWPVEDGVQGAIRNWASECSEYTSQGYRLRHVATFEKVERASLEQAIKAGDEERRKLGNAY